MENNRVALVTGGSQGLGFSLSKRLLKDGWAVITDARNRDGLLDKAKLTLEKYGNVTCISGDVSDSKHIQRLVDAIQSFGRVDLVVNNASTLGATPLPGLLDCPVDCLEEVYRANVFAPLAILQAVKPFLKQDAVIVNITSDAGREAYPGWGAYGSSKAALEHLSAVMSVENPDLHIYWVDPGDMRTKMKQDSDPDEDISSLPLPDQVVPGFMEIIQGELPSGRYQAQEL